MERVVAPRVRSCVGKYYCYYDYYFERMHITTKLAAIKYEVIIGIGYSLYFHNLHLEEHLLFFGSRLKITRCVKNVYVQYMDERRRRRDG